MILEFKLDFMSYNIPTMLISCGIEDLGEVAVIYNTVVCSRRNLSLNWITFFWKKSKLHTKAYDNDDNPNRLISCGVADQGELEPSRRYLSLILRHMITHMYLLHMLITCIEYLVYFSSYNINILN